MICDNIGVNCEGHLTFAGKDTLELAKKYGTPLYLMDENKIREHIRTYKTAMAEFFPEGSIPEYASKAFSCKAAYRIANEEGIAIDTVSIGEIYTAKSTGFPMEKCFFHGNNKTDYDIEFAIDNGVGYFVSDSLDEIYTLDRIAKEKGIIQKIILRLTPGIDTHTHKKISTGNVDSKFGIAIETGQGFEAVKEILSLKNIKLVGFHNHIGSQIFEITPFKIASKIMLKFIKEVKEKLNFNCEILNLGGGLGVRYIENQPIINYYEMIKEISEVLKKYSEKFDLKLPRISMEPGRSLVADAGMTLYTVGSIKQINGYKNYVSVDGGMSDNPRFALYEAPYTVLLANNPEGEYSLTADVVGRCCESGDIIQEKVKLPKVKRGDIVAVLTTGAYNYSMASNYNRICRPPVVMIKDNKEYIAVKRETLEDICSLDV